MAKTRLGSYGGPRQEYGTFSRSPIVIAKGQQTRLGLYGGPRGVYGNFSKAEIVQSKRSGSMLSSLLVRRRMRRGRR